MESSHAHVLLLFWTFILAMIVLIDGVTYVSMAGSDFPATREGRTAWTDLVLYAITIPVFSVFGSGLHIFGLHLDWISYLPETSSEGLVLTIGSAAHSAGWLIISSIWTTCEAGTMSVKTVNTPGQPISILVRRTGPAFCPQMKFIDGGYSLGGGIALVKVVLAWIIFVVTLCNLFCATRGWVRAGHPQGTEDTARHQRTMRSFEGTAGPSWSAPAGATGSYETKV